MFSCGADLKERKLMDIDEAREYASLLRNTFNRLEQLACPTISILDGPALGSGFDLALCTDIRVATQHAYFGSPETGFGIIPSAGGTQRLPRTISKSLAKEMIFTGENMNAY